jgi:hypothetical protein
VADAEKAPTAGAPPTSRTSWPAGLRVEMTRIRTAICATGSEDPIARSVRASLDYAESLLRAHGSAPWFLRVGRGGRTYEAALAVVQQAAQDALLVVGEATVLAAVAEIRAAVRATFPPSDPRFDAYVQLCDRLLGAPVPPLPPARAERASAG